MLQCSELQIHYRYSRVSLLSVQVPMHKDTIKFITGTHTHTNTNNKHQYGYQYFSAENYKIQVPVLICIVQLHCSIRYRYLYSIIFPVTELLTKWNSLSDCCIMVNNFKSHIFKGIGTRNKYTLVVSLGSGLCMALPVPT